MITLQELKQNPAITALIHAGNRYLESMGYTDHGPRHLRYVSKTAASILRQLGYEEREVELAAICGWVHDVGNSINRHGHGQTGAVLLFPILKEAGMALPDVMDVITAVGNHDEGSGFISTPIAAALVLGDKSDAHKSRVRYGKPNPADIHDRVNFSIQTNQVTVDVENRVIRQEMTMDDTSSVLEYFEIYTQRIAMCEKAARFLDCSFDLVINGYPVNNRVPKPQQAAQE